MVLILMFILLVLAGLILFFHYSMKRTLYSFLNIGLLAVILYISMFLLVLILQGGYQISMHMQFDLFDLFWLFLEFPRRLSVLSVFILVVLGIAMAISNLSLLKHEGLRITNTVAAMLMAAFLFIILGLQHASRFVGETVSSFEAMSNSTLYNHAYPYVFMFLFDMVCYFECVFFAMIIMGFVVARQVPKYDKDFIIILGCSIAKDGKLKPLIKGRTNRAIRYAWNQEIASGKPVKYVPSGGKGSDEYISEGSAMELYLLSHGAEEYEVLAEKESKNTYENFVFSKRLIDANLKDAKVAFATTKYHMLRSGIIARKAGFSNIEAIGSDTKWYFWPNGFAREMIAMYVMGKKYHIVMGVVSAFLCSVGYLLSQI